MPDLRRMRMERTPGGHDGGPICESSSAPELPDWTPDPKKQLKLQCRSVVAIRPELSVFSRTNHRSLKLNRTCPGFLLNNYEQ